MWDGHMDAWVWWAMVPLMVLTWALVVWLAVAIYRRLVAAPARGEHER
jgi:hypothetical protein